MLLSRWTLAGAAQLLSRAGSCSRWAVAAPLCAALLLVACSPALDWRDVRSGQGALVSLFPCKPTVEVRDAARNGGVAAASLQVCEAQDMTFAILSVSPLVAAAGAPATLAPTDTAQALDAMMGSAAARWGEPSAGPDDAAQPSVAAHLQARCRRWSRSLGEGRTFHTQACFLAHQGYLYQVSLSGVRLDATALDAFFGSLRLSS